MPQLTREHIDYIIKDLDYRGVVLDGFRDEVVDHICSAVETELSNGGRFLDAYLEVLRRFGHTHGLRETQKQVLITKNQKTKFMIRNYFTIAFRNLRKHRFYSFINIFGLAMGIASCLIIVLFVINELSYDRYHTKAERIYRVNTEIKYGSNHYRLAVCSAPMAEALRQDYPEVEAAVRFRNRGSWLVKRGEHVDNFKEERVIFTDSTFFRVFSVPVLEGDGKTALREPNTMAISRSMAKKYFPGESALGQTLILDNNLPTKVTAVFEDMPSAGHFHFDILVALSGLDEAKSTSFLGNNFNTYVLLKPGTDPEQFQAKLPGVVEKHIGPQIGAALGGDFSMKKFRDGGNIFEFTLMPVTDIHLHSDLTAELEPNSDVTYVYLFGAIALFILVIACINFMNLSTARSANRAKEVGIRKVMGSLRLHLVRQFLMESILLSACAFVLAIILASAFMPAFNDLSLKKLSVPLTDPFFYLVLFSASLIIGVMAGLYPSFFLSAFKPVNVLKGNVALGMKSGFIRSALVVFQFVISIILIIGTITINRQLNYIQNKKIGFEKDQVIVVYDAYALGDKLQVFKDQVLQNNMIQSGTITGYLPVSGTWRNDNSFWPEGSQPTEENMVGIQNWTVDHDYVKTMQMKIKSGRDFSAEFLSDSSAMILNEAAVNSFNFGSDPIGKRITTFEGQNPDGTPDPSRLRSWTVIGVIEDFHFESLRQNIGPLALMLDRSNGMISFRFKAENAQNVIGAIESIWKNLAPGQPFQYSFLDEDFSRMYSSEQRLGKIFALFAGFAIFIACLGLFALTAFTAEQRTKEIGIRKVLGASVPSIVVLLSKEFGKLIIIAFVLAAPLAWYAVTWWLESYTYKVEVGVFVYILAGVLAFLVAWFTMGYQSIKAATANPVNSLRSE
jgi:putative ABC transport system permease protein